MKSIIPAAVKHWCEMKKCVFLHLCWFCYKTITLNLLYLPSRWLQQSMIILRSIQTTVTWRLIRAFCRTANTTWWNLQKNISERPIGRPGQFFSHICKCRHKIWYSRLHGWWNKFYTQCYFHSDSQRQRSKKGKETKELSDMVKFSKV